MTRILIIEDEKYAADRLKSLLLEVMTEFEITAVKTSIKESVGYLRANKVDLIFLDINLSDGYSFEIFNQVAVDAPIIFTTAYDEYALKAFKLNSVDYLLKPIKNTELSLALSKLETLQNTQWKEKYQNLVKDISSGDFTELKSRFLISFGNKLRTIKIEDIAYFFARDKGVYINTFEGRRFSIDETLDSIQNQVNPKSFFRINRHLLIHFDSIKDMAVVANNRIRLELNPKFDEDVCVASARTKDFKVWLQK